MMFQRILWHLLRGNRVRMTVALLALTSGGAVVSALLNLNVDISHRLSQEFRSLGANLVISSQTTGAASGNSAALIDASEMKTAEEVEPSGSIASPYLYLVAHPIAAADRNVVVAGAWLDRLGKLSPWWKISGNALLGRDDVAHCLIGRNVSRAFNVSAGGMLTLEYEDRTAKLVVSGIIDGGGSEDNQIFVSLPVAQKLAGAEGKIQLIELSVPGSPDEIRTAQSRLQAALPGLAVKPIPQITEAEGQLLRRIRFLTISTGLLILILTALCVLATMTALAMERRKDVGLMKALGGSMQRVLRIFLAEVGILGFAGGAIGYLVGIFISIWIGHRVFGTSVAPRWEVFPATVILMLIVSLAGALPLRLLGNIRPAVILRGE